MKFSSEMAGTITGIRFYKAAANTGSPRRQPVERHRDAAGLRHVQRRNRLGLAAGELRQTRLDQRQHHLRGRLPRAERALLGGASGLASAVTNAPLSALSNAISANGVYAYAAASTFPTSSFKATNYYVDVDFPPTPAPGPATNVTRHRRHLKSATVCWSAPTEGGSVGRIQDHPLHRQRSPGCAHAQGLAPGDRDDDLQRAEKRHQLHASRVQAFNSQRAGPAVGALQRRHARGPESALRAAVGEGQRGHRPGAGQLERTGQQRRQPDDRLQGDPVPRGQRPTPVEAPAGASSATV